MKFASSSIPVLGTILLHAALIVFTINGLSSSIHDTSPPKPVQVQVQLLQERPRPAEKLPAAPAQPQPQNPAREHKPHTTPKPQPQPREQPAAHPKAPDIPIPMAQTSVDAAPAPARSDSAAPAAASAAPVPPVKRGVFVDPSYLATETEKWYPRQAKRYGDQGSVLLHVTVSAAGRAEKVELRKGSGYPLLDSAAVELAKSITYRPATLDGKPVSDSFNLPITFQLHD